jgi:hypothetical protein
MAASARFWVAPVHGQVGEKSLDFSLAHVTRMLHPVKNDKALDPVDVCTLGVHAVLVQSKLIANSLEHPGFGHLT